MSDQKILDNAPFNATHYSPWRNTYYRLRDGELHKLGGQFGNEWRPCNDSINLNKWLDLAELDLSLQEAAAIDNWNDGYWVEGLDRAYTLTVMFEQLLGNSAAGYHPAIVRAGLQHQCDAVSLQIADLYTAIGAATPD